MRLYGHRGAPAVVAENTLESFARALEDGADAIETDVHLTSDGVLVVSHDPDGRRCANVPRRIDESTLAEVQTWERRGGLRIPTLEEALEAFPDTLFNVDLKPGTIESARAALRVLDRMKAASRVQLASFRDEPLRFVRREAPEVVTSLGTAEVWWLLAMPRALLRRWPLGGRRAQVPTRAGRLRLDTPGFIDKAHALGLAVDYWVVNSPEEARRLERLGADGVITDDPGLISGRRRAP